MKVDVARATDPVAHVRRILRGIAESSDIRVEEIFPALRAGHSAGLMTVHLPHAAGSPEHEASIKALEGDDAVVYVQEPKRRRHRVR